MFSDAVVSMLTAVGWSPNRRVDVKPLILPLRQEGFYFNPQSISILENLGGLAIRPPKMPEDIYLKGPLCFDLDQASGRRGVIAYWEDRFATCLSPIAGDDNNASYFVGDSGAVFASLGAILYLIDFSFEASMENVLMVARLYPREIGVMFFNRRVFYPENNDLEISLLNDNIGGVEEAAWGKRYTASWDAIRSADCVDGLFPKLLRFYFNQLEQVPSDDEMSGLCMSLKQLLERLTKFSIMGSEFKRSIEDLIERPLIAKGKIKYEVARPAPKV